jgi:Kdo2-lipid IVA 3' secondary acyltransferase
VTGPPKRRSFLQRLRKRLHPFFAPLLLRLTWAIVPRLYVAYMWLVWKTSRVEDCGYPTLAWQIIEEHDGLVALLWHEEVFGVAWSYREMKPHTLANVGDSGELITRLLERCGYVVFRGGSSRRKSRQRETVLLEMIRHMRETRRVVYGITVDGSIGPYHVVKPGALLIAQKCKKPIVLARTWAKRNIRLPTWDRMALPLPFNHIRQLLTGPFFVPENADADTFERCRHDLERKLVELAERSLVWDR